MKIPNVCIHIPGTHSRTLFYPKYTFELFKRLWTPRLEDPADPVRIIPFPKGISKKHKVRVVTSMEEEKKNWQNFFEENALFDIVKPGDTFEREFEALLEAMANAKPEDAEEEEKILIPEEISGLEGVSSALALALVRAGFKTLASIANSTLAGLMETEGLEAPLAKQLREHALAEVGELVVTEEE